MKFSKLDLLTLLISLFIFSSCNKSNTLGLDLDPNNAIQGNLVDTLTISTRTVTDDPLTTYLGTSGSNPTRYPLGFLKDPDFGTSQASLALSVSTPGNTAYTFGTNPVIDSAVLVLPYSTQFYGDTTSSVYTVNVHQLKSNMDNETSFVSNREWKYDPAVYGTYSAKIKPTTPFKITSIVAGAADTLKSVVPQMRIKLNNSFIQQNIANLSTSQLLNRPSFTDVFKGLYLTASTTGTGGMMFMNFASNSKLEVYYKRQNATTTTAIDTVYAEFAVGTTSGPVAAKVDHTWSTGVQAQLDAPMQQFATTYLQPLAGLRTKVSFPSLKNLLKTIGGRIVINKAELLVDVSNGTDAIFPALQNLTLYRLDIAGQRSYLPDNTAGLSTGADPRAAAQFFSYDTTKKQYKFILTAYLQDILDGKTMDYGTYIAPTAPEYSIGSSVSIANRSIIGSFQNTTNRVKLNIYYTKIN